MNRRAIFLALAEALSMWGAAQGTPIRLGFDASSLLKRDDAWSSGDPLGFDLDFFGTSYSHVCVNTNGNVTFEAPNLAFIPFDLTTASGIPIIAPFFADVDLRGAGSDVVRYGTGVVDGHNALGVTWLDVGYFWKHDDKLNRFQLVLIDRSDRGPGNVDLEFNYERILWESGDWSGGTGGLGGSSARAGYANGTGQPGTYYEFRGSGVPGAFLDGSPTGLIHHSRSSSIPGRYVFPITGDQGPAIPAPGALALAAIGTACVGWRRRGRTR